MDVKKIIRFLLRRRAKPDESQVKVGADKARADENLSRIKDIMERVAATQERTMKLLAKPNKEEQE